MCVIEQSWAGGACRGGALRQSNSIASSAHVQVHSLSFFFSHFALLRLLPTYGNKRKKDLARKGSFFHIHRRLPSLHTTTNGEDRGDAMRLDLSDR